MKDSSSKTLANTD